MTAVDNGCVGSAASDLENQPRAFSVPFPDPGAGCRLVVFPHAGSGAAYYRILAKALVGSGVETLIAVYPGRETRIGELPAQTHLELVSRLEPTLAALVCDGKPFVFTDTAWAR